MAGLDPDELEEWRTIFNLFDVVILASHWLIPSYSSSDWSVIFRTGTRASHTRSWA